MTENNNIPEIELIIKASTIDGRRKGTFYKPRGHNLRGEKFKNFNFGRFSTNFGEFLNNL